MINYIEWETKLWERVVLNHGLTEEEAIKFKDIFFDKLYEEFLKDFNSKVDAKISELIERRREMQEWEEE